MEQADRVRNVCQCLEEAMPLSTLVRVRAQVRPQWSEEEAAADDPQTGASLERMEESLAHAYLAANLNMQTIPLRAFLESFEKRVLLSCLRLTQGNQKNVAAVLGLKPTALSEKMRKHGLRAHRERPLAAMGTSAARESA